MDNGQLEEEIVIDDGSSEPLTAEQRRDTEKSQQIIRRERTSRPGLTGVFYKLLYRIGDYLDN